MMLLGFLYSDIRAMNCQYIARDHIKLDIDAGKISFKCPCSKKIIRGIFNPDILSFDLERDVENAILGICPVKCKTYKIKDVRCSGCGEILYRVIGIRGERETLKIPTHHLAPRPTNESEIDFTKTQCWFCEAKEKHAINK